jgi:hypothetical protein
VTAPPTCPSCGQPRTTRYCGHCGERAIAPDELSFKRFLTALGEELFPGFDADDGPAVRRMGGRVYRTVYTLFRHPGQLTADYIAGRRRPYLKPIQVFLTISVLFFLFGHNYFQFTLGEYEQVPVFGETFDAVAAEQQRLRLTAEQYEERFNERLATHKKAVMALTVPLFALGFMPLFRRRRYGEHVVFSIHFFALQLLFMITIMYAVFRIMVAMIRLLMENHPAAAQAIGQALDSEPTLVFMVYFPLFLWLFVALRRVYGGGRLVNVLKALVLVCWHIVMLVVVFKTTLFFTTFYSLKWFG